MRFHDVRSVAAATQVDELPAPHCAEIAFAGRSNVGKSSLINVLVQRKKLVRTSGTPGCTRKIQLLRVELVEPEAVLDLVDLPGYGHAQRSKAERKSWGPLIEGFLRTRAGLRAIVVIVDIRRGVEEDDQQLIDLIKSLGKETILVATKLDKLPTSKRKLRLAELSREAGAGALGFSASKKLGMDALWKRLLRAASIGAAPAPQA